MKNTFLCFLFFLIYSLQTHCSDGEREQLIAGGHVGLAPTERLNEPSFQIDATSTQTKVHLSEDEDIEEVSQDRDEIQTYLTRSQDEVDFFNYMQEDVFTCDDSMRSTALRWGFRVGGFLAENGMTPMLLYVILNLFNVTPGSYLDWIIIGSSLVYFFLPSVENLGECGVEFGQGIVDLFHCCCSPTPEPEMIQVPRDIPVLYKGISPSWTIPIRVMNNVHAFSMALILTTVFHHIENSKVAQFDWFFLTCFFPYSIAIFYKNKNFFSHGRRIEKAHHTLETKSQKSERRILEQQIRMFEKELSNLSHEALKTLYTHLKNPRKTALQKLAILNDTLAKSRRSTINDGYVDSDLAHVARQNYDRPRTILEKVPEPIKNMTFYGSVFTEFAFLQFGFGLFCKDIGISNSVAQAIISNTGASILTGASFLLEDASIEAYYENLVSHKRLSTQSVSNFKTRVGIELIALAGGTLIALSETYPAWNANLSGSYGAYALLILMVARHLPRNAYGLANGFNLALTNWHLRNCNRDRCRCTSCRRGQDADEMINYISSQVIYKLPKFVDRLNHTGIKLISRALLGHQVNDRTL